jgi:NTP pyrophosphatase (non-canonical NTP hydrolase)
MKSYRAIEMDVIQWAQDRQIIPNSTPLAQAIKTTEELSELLKALSKGDMAEAKDAYSDILITLIIGADLAGFDLVDCLNDGYEVIKNRQGFLTKDGIFVKQE